MLPDRGALLPVQFGPIIYHASSEPVRGSRRALQGHRKEKAMANPKFGSGNIQLLQLAEGYQKHHVTNLNTP